MDAFIVAFNWADVDLFWGKFNLIMVARVSLLMTTLSS